MKFWVISDLHLDVNAAHYNLHLKLHAPHDYDAIIVAGDVCERVEVAVSILANYNFPRASKIFFVPGNHEFWHDDIYVGLHEGHARSRIRARNDVTFLYDNEVTIDDLTIAGAPLWTDFNFFGTPAQSRLLADANFSDFQNIRYDAKPFKTEHAIKDHLQSIEFLTGAVKKAKKNSRKTLVITHHAPHVRSVRDKYLKDPYTPCFASANVITGELQPDLWIHGHIHNSVDYLEGKTRVVCNPHGYGMLENTKFNPRLVVEL